MSSRSPAGLRPAPRVLFSLLVSLALSACGGGSGSGDTTYAIKATVSGLENNSVVLQVNGDAGITISQNASVILGYLPAGKDYTVTVKTYPTNPTETCAVFNEKGTVGHADVQDVTVTCSTHAISVLQFEPAKDSTNAWVHDPIVIHFSSPVDPKSINADSLSVSIGTFAVGHQILAVDGDPNALEIKLNAAPPVPANMTVTLTGNIADTSGNRLLVPNGGLVWTWQYPAWQALGGTALQNVDATAFTWIPAVAVSGGGDIYVAFAEAMPIPAASGAMIYQLIVKHWDGTAWERLGDPLNVDVSEQIMDQPSIAVDPADEPIVAFNEKHGGVATVYVRRWNGSAWDLLGATGLNGDSTENANSPVLALDTSGNPIVAWQEATVATGDGSPHRVLLTRWNNGWGPAIALDSAVGADAILPSIATDSSGGAYVAFNRAGGGAYELLMTRITWNTGSSPQQASFENIASDPHLRTTAGGHTSVAVSQDAAYVAYPAGSPSATYVLRCTPLVASQSSPAPTCDSWGGALVGDSTRGANSPSMTLMTVDGTDYPVVAWDEWTIDRTFGTFIVEAWNGLNWARMAGMPMPIEPGSKAHSPQLAFNDGQLVVVWRELTSDISPSKVFVKRYNQ